jgi:hypothetical protein
VSPVRYELGFYTPEDDIVHSYRRKNKRPYKGNVITMNGHLFLNSLSGTSRVP